MKMSVQIGASSTVIVLENPKNPSKADIQKLIDTMEEVLQTLPATEVHFGTSSPDNPKEGDLWFNPSENRLYAYVTS